MTTYSPSARTSEGKAPINSRMRSPPGVRTVKLVLASASAPGELTSLSVNVAKRWRMVRSMTLPDGTLISAATIEFVGDGALGPLPGPGEAGVGRARRARPFARARRTRPARVEIGRHDMVRPFRQADHVAGHGFGVD